MYLRTKYRISGCFFFACQKFAKVVENLYYFVLRFLRFQKFPIKTIPDLISAYSIITSLIEITKKANIGSSRNLPNIL